MSDIKYKKHFRVGSVTRRYGDWVCILVSQDGDCWRVNRAASLRSVPWKVGKVLLMPMRLLAAFPVSKRGSEPAWDVVKATNPQRFYLANPAECVEFVWGRETAQKFFAPPSPRSTELDHRNREQDR